jgi:lisH domain-containing protein FOPNL
MAATLDELKEALIETLDNRGVLGQVKAKVRAEIFAALDDEQIPRPKLPRENVIINELFREYLEYNGYHHTVSVLLPESGHPEERQFDRPFLASELRLQEDDRSRSLPLIYALVRGMRPQAPHLPGDVEAEAVGRRHVAEAHNASFGGPALPAANCLERDAHLEIGMNTALGSGFRAGGHSNALRAQDACYDTAATVGSAGWPFAAAAPPPSLRPLHDDRVLDSNALHQRGIAGDLGDQAEPLVIRGGGAQAGVSASRAWEPEPLASLMRGAPETGMRP